MKRPQHGNRIEKIEDAVHGTDTIVRLFDDGWRVRDIASHCHRGTRRVTEVLTTSGRTVVKGNSPEAITEKEQETVCSMFRQGMLYHHIAQSLQCLPERVKRILKANGIDPRSNRRIGPNANNWAGGSFRKQDGYCIVWIGKDSPFASMADSKGYTQEHRLVMAKQLGRPLERWETVHHIDGDKSNNDPSNLQLMIGKHPKGQAYRCADCGSERIRPVEIERTH